MIKDKVKNKSIHLSTLTIIAISITVAAAVAVSVFSFITVYNRSLVRDASTSSEQAVGQATGAVNNYLQELKVKIDQICGEISDSKNIDEVNERIAVASRLQTDIEAIMVYDKDGNLLAFSSNGNKLKNDTQLNLSFDKSNTENIKGYNMSLPHVENLFYEYYPWVVTITHPEYEELFGETVYITVDFSFSNIAKYIDNVGIGQHGYCYIADESGNIVYHPQQQMIFSGIKQEDISDVVKLADGVHRNNNIIYSLNTLDNNSWRIVGISHIDELTSEKTETILRVVLITMLCCSAIAIAVVLVFSKIVTKPVRGIVAEMQKFEHRVDDFKYSPVFDRVAEVQVISESFEHMSGMIKDLMDEVRAEEITLRKTELKALQAQINPHFLYNTLDSIQWMCEQGKNEDAVKMVGALAKLFRISISRGHELISIKDELKHAESYLIIQSYRYKNQFKYTFNVDKSVEDCFVNKITVQPLIENAIYHGLDRMVDEGEIDINVSVDLNNDILIDVRDNGVGMTSSQCVKILKKERSDSSGIGIKNVNDRLKIYFGENYGISIKSELDVGTTVTVRIPQLREEPENEV